MFVGSDHFDANIRMEAMISFWSLNPVHGSKMADTKIATSMVDLLKKCAKKDETDLGNTTWSGRGEGTIILATR